MRKFTILLVIAALAALAIIPVLAQDEATGEEMAPTAHIRVAHFSPDTPAVDVYLDGELSDVQQLEFPSVTGWIDVPAGTYSVAVAPAGTSVDDAAIGPADLTFDADSWTTIAAVGSLEDGTLAPALFTENYSNIPAGSARVGLFHAIAGAPAVDVLVDGSAVVTQLAYPNTQAGNDGFFEVEVPAGTYDVQVVSSDGGDVLIDLPETTFDLNQSYLVAAVAGADGPTVEVTSSTVPGNSIYDVLVSDSRFSTLVSALLSANLGETLDTGGPFTVFAPTNGAFDAILNSLGMTSADMMTDGLNLGPVLLYHVVDGEVKAEALVTMDSVTTLQGEDITVSTGNFGAVLNGDVNVTRTDLTADNGVIHIVNHVLLPPSLAEVLGMSMGDETMAEEMTEEPMMEATEEPMMEATEEPMEATEEAPMEATEEPPTATEEASS